MKSGMPDFNPPPPSLVMVNLIGVKSAENVDENLQVLSSLLQSMLESYRHCPVCTYATIKFFGQLLQSMFTEIKLTITGGCTGSGAIENFAPALIQDESIKWKSPRTC